VWSVVVVVVLLGFDDSGCIVNAGEPVHVEALVTRFGKMVKEHFVSQNVFGVI
jgi:hypothetical protein